MRYLVFAGKALEALRQLKLQNSARSEYLFPSPTVVFDPKSGRATAGDSGVRTLNAQGERRRSPALSLTLAN